MVSPVANGLFHRAILMSGSALSDWALSSNVLATTMQVAEAINCPLVDENEEFLKCLRKRRLVELMGVKVSLPEFAAHFAPIIDGLVVPNAAHKVMGQYSDIFSRFVKASFFKLFKRLSVGILCVSSLYFEFAYTVSCHVVFIVLASNVDCSIIVRLLDSQ